MENYKITLMTPLKSPVAAGFLQHQKKKIVNKQHQTPLNNINTMEGQIFVSFFFLPYVLETSFVIVAAILKALSTTFLLLPCTKPHNLDNYDTGVDLNANVTSTLERQSTKGILVGDKGMGHFFFPRTNKHPSSPFLLPNQILRNPKQNLQKDRYIYQFQRASNNCGQRTQPTFLEFEEKTVLP
ncbi:hypothetical protein glysoja_040248 [Glycine soja]|uniref:Uncharacterized protein n=1 Tax=Glycine soja TaxID=3848 RepID=A0A0B2QT81_GLYSO|nr:hypothetical protein glysoja_040248 [Glycine soja]